MAKRKNDNKVKIELAARAGGRCEMCGAFLFTDNYGFSTNYGENAHIDPFSNKGPRGVLLPKEIVIDNNGGFVVGNLLFLCSSCHTMIDKNPDRYTKEWLMSKKRLHEERIYKAGNVSISKTIPVKFSSRRDNKQLEISDEEIKECLFNEYTLCNSDIVDLSLDTIKNANETYESYYERCSLDLESKYIRLIETRKLNISNCSFSLFALAPQPLLIKLGRLFDDGSDHLDIRNLSRGSNKWQWKNGNEPLEINLIEPNVIKGNKIVLALEISGEIANNELDEDSDIYRIRANNIGIDTINSDKDLDLFGKIVRAFFAIINKAKDKPVHVYCAMPQSLAIKFGSVYMPHAYNTMIIYDKCNIDGELVFVKTLTISE